MEGIIQLALLVLIVASVIFLLKCPSALSEIAFSLRCARDPDSSKAISEIGKAIGEGLKSMSRSIESLKSTESLKSANDLTWRDLESIGEGLKFMGNEIGGGLSSISSSLDSFTQGSLALTHESVMFKCDDETVISLSFVVSTYKEGEGFRVEMSVSGKGSSSKLISQSEHKRLLKRMSDLGYLEDERFSPLGAFSRKAASS